MEKEKPDIHRSGVVMQDRKTGNGLLVAVFSLLIQIFVAGCGLQDIPYYYPPVLTDSGVSANTFTVTHDIRNYDSASLVQYFTGYEIYYRAYTNSSDASAAIAAMQSEIDRSDGSPSRAFEKLESLQFKRLYNADNSAAPIDDRPILRNFPLTAASFFTFYLKDSENWFYTADGADPEAVGSRHFVSRYPSGTTTSQPFYLKSGYLAGDSDYTGSYSSPDTLYFVFYGVAYGQDSQSPLTVVPSFPNYSTSFFTFTPG
ncbi:MAG: hypothetical protein Q8O19_08120 [Rectinemataceae bacterium]|nr:hypothetical protein [Rectinemataceae bacterium]